MKPGQGMTQIRQTEHRHGRLLFVVVDGTHLEAESGGGGEGERKVSWRCVEYEMIAAQSPAPSARAF